jgi:hypothetical protein
MFRSMKVVLIVYSLARFVWGGKPATFIAIILVMLVVPVTRIIEGDVET